MKAEIFLERITSWPSTMSILLGIVDIRILNERGIPWTINKIGGKVVIPVDEEHQREQRFRLFQCHSAQTRIRDSHHTIFDRVS